jgi:hypothetical protein
MGSYDENCLICAGPIENNVLARIKEYAKYHSIDMNKYKDQIKQYMESWKWLDNLFIITSTEGKVVATGKKYNGSGAINVNNNIYAITPVNWHAWYNNKYHKEFGNKYGIVCHQDCYKLLQTKLNYKLQFADVSRILSVGNCVLKQMSKYRPANKYMNQLYNFIGVLEENAYILTSPLKNKINADRIIKMWTPLAKKFKAKIHRPSPSESATQFPVGTVIYGHDGKQWIVKSSGIKKWFRV